MELFQIEGVRFRSILTYPNISIAAGRTTFVRGQSGCGKSTLLRLLNATQSPDTGTILYRGVDILTLDTIALRREILLMSQSAYLFPGSILDNFRLYYHYRGQAVPLQTTMEQYLHTACVPFSLSARCDNLSGGERQRVFAAICLSFLPKVLLLDEPTSALDAKTADLFFQEVTSFCLEKGITLIAVSHDEALAQRYAEDTIFLERQAM